jgi:ribosomal protein L16/L10AE
MVVKKPPVSNKKVAKKKNVKKKSRGNLSIKSIQIQDLKFKKIHCRLSYSTATNNYRSINLRRSAIFKSLDAGRLTFKQLESCILILKRFLKKMNRRKKSTLRIFCIPTIPVTKKPLSIRMGKGIGAISFWVSPIRKGGILFEITNIKFYKAMFLYNQVKQKFPFRLRLFYV